MTIEDEAREHREANHTDAPAVDAPQAAPTEPTAKAGPLAAYFMALAAFQADQAVKMAIQLELLSRPTPPREG